MTPTPNKYTRKGETVSRVEFYQVKGEIKPSLNDVVIELYPDEKTVLELHFGDPVKLMDFLVLLTEGLAKAFPDSEAAKLWNDPSLMDPDC